MSDNEKRRYFNELSTRWDAMPASPDKTEKVAEFCRQACRSGAGRVLDVGSGTGLLTPHLMEFLPGALHLVESDYALDMLRESRRKLPSAPVSRVCADALALPFSAESFDTVLCYGIIPHLGDTATALRELWRVVRTGGSISIGHHLGSEPLNALHRNIGGPVGGDTLLSANAMTGILNQLGATSVQAADEPKRYFVRAEKGRL